MEVEALLKVIAAKAVAAATERLGVIELSCLMLIWSALYQNVMYKSIRLCVI